MSNQSGLDRIIAERARQQEIEGWTPAHDDDHEGGELALAAVAYAAHAAGEQVYIRDSSDEECADPQITLMDPWPWERQWDKRRTYAASNTVSDPRRVTTTQRIDLLTKAGALIAAEIDRLIRLESETTHEP